MRITLTIDDDVADALNEIRKSHPEKSFKEFVNAALKKGVESHLSSPNRAPFKVKSMKLGMRKDLNFDNIEEVLDILEGPNRR